MSRPDQVSLGPGSESDESPRAATKAGDPFVQGNELPFMGSERTAKPTTL